MDEEELKRLVDSMIKGGESEEAIAMVIRKYSKPVKPEKKNDVPSTSKDTESESEQKAGSSVGVKSKGFARIDAKSIAPDYPAIEEYPTKKAKSKLANDSSDTKNSKGFPYIDKNSVAPNYDNPDQPISRAKEPEKEEQRSIFAKKVDDLGRGSLRLGAFAASIPELSYQIFSAPQNAIAGIFDAPSLHTDPDKFKKSLGIKNHIKDYYLEEIEKSREHSKRVDKYYEKGIYDSFASGDIAGGFDLVTSSFLESLPSTIAMMVGGAYVKSAELLAASTMFFGAGKNEELRREHPEMSTEARTANALGSGLAEGAGELLGSGSIGAAARGLIEREGVKKGLTLLKDGLQKITINAIKKNPLLASMGVEGFEEWSTTVAQNAVGVATGEKPHDYNIFTGAADSFIGGAFGGGVFGGGMKGVQTYVDGSDRISFKKNNTAIFELAREAENPNHSATTKSQIKSSIDQLIKNNQIIIKKGIANVETLSPELKEKYVESVEKLATIKERVAEIRDHETYSPETKKIMLAQLQTEAKEVFELRKNIIEGNTTTVDVLPLKEQNELQKQARESLVAELNPDGTKDLTLTNEQILKRANEIYSKSQKNEAKAAKKLEKEAAEKKATENLEVNSAEVVSPTGQVSTVESTNIDQAAAKDYKVYSDQNIPTMTVVENNGEFLIGNYTPQSEGVNPTVKAVTDLENNPLSFKTKEEAQAKLDEVQGKKVENPKAEDNIGYHGTNAEFDEFNTESSGTATDVGWFGKGVYFHSDSDRGAYAESKGGRVIKAKLDLKNPIILPVDNSGQFLFDIVGEKAVLDESFRGESAQNIIKEIGSENFTKIAVELGYDGVVVNYVQGTKETVVFDAKSIEIIESKSTNNETTQATNTNTADEEVGKTAKALETVVPKEESFALAISTLPKAGIINYKDIKPSKYALPFARYFNKPNNIMKDVGSAYKIYEFLKGGGKLPHNVLLLDENGTLLDGNNRLKAQLALGITDFEYAIKTDKLFTKSNYQTIAEAYHKAKAENNNPELVKEVEKLLGNETTQATNTAANGANGVGTSTNGTQGQNDSVQSSVDSQTSEGEASVVNNETSVLVAPYYDTTITNLAEAKPLRESSGYKKHIKMLQSVAKTLGIKILNVEETIGGFVNEEGKKITEISNRVHLDTNDLNKAEEFAAIVGALAYETQEATIAVKYVEIGSQNQSAVETELKVSDLEKSIELLKAEGVNDFEANEAEGTIKILDFSNGQDSEYDGKMSNFVKSLIKNNISHEAKYRAIESRYVDPVRRTELLEAAKSSANQRQGGANVRNLYKTAVAQNQRFLDSKNPPVVEAKVEKPKPKKEVKPKPKPKPVVDKTEQEIDLEHALSEIDKGVLTWNGDMKAKRVNLELTWHDIRKGEADLKAGKTNTAPAKRLIEALKDAKEAGGYNYLKGQGAAAIGTFESFTPQTKAEKRIDIANASIEDIQERLKKYLIPAHINPDDYHTNGFSTAQIIDTVAQLAKIIAKGTIITLEHIEAAINQLKADFEINIDPQLVFDTINPKVKNEKTSSKLEGFRDKIKDMPQSGNFSKYLSGETIKEEHSPTRNNQSYEVVLLEDMGKHGVEAVEMAKEVFGDEYVEKTLDFLEEANLKAHEAALMYVSLENEMHKRVLADPNNVGEKKLQDLVRAKSQKHLNISAVAINAGRLRAIMKYRYIPDGVSSRMYSNKQKTAKKKLQKAVEATADEVNDEAEEQEQEVEDELNEEDYDFQVTPPKEKRNIKTVKAELKDVFAKMRADALKAAKGGSALSSVPFATQLAAVAPHILKAAKLLAEIGGLTTRQIIETIHEEFHKVMPSLSKKDVADAIRNGQKKKGGKPSPEAQRKLYINRLRKDIAELDKQIVNRKKVVRKRNATYDNDPEITDLREIKKAMQEELAKADPAYGEANKLKADLKAAQQSLENWETKIRNNDFTAAERSAKPVDQELQKLRDKRDAKRVQYQEKKAVYEKSFLTPEMIAEKKLNARIRVVKKTIADLKEKLANPTLNNNAGRSSYWSNELSNLEQEATDLRKQIAANKKASIAPESIAEKKVKAKIDAINKSIADLQDKIDNPRENTNAGKNSLWTKEIGELKQKQAELQKILAERKKAAQLQNAKAPLTAEEKLTNAKQRVRTRIEDLQEQIAVKKVVLKYAKKNTDAELKALEAEERELKKEAQKYLSDADKTLLEERKKEAIAIGLESQIAEIESQIADGVKKAVEAKKDPLESPRINQLKAEKKAKLAILEAIDPTPKEFIKQALIEAGFGREITVTTKNGKEKRQVVDWKKLAGEEGSVDKIRERVEQALKDKGYSQAEIERMKDAFEEEYNNLRAGIIQKGLNELENRNAFKKKVNTKSASKRLAELYNYGLFEKEAGTYDRLMNSALGFSEFDHETFEDLKALARSVALLHNSGTSELGISIPITSLNKEISRVLTKAHLKRGITHYILANIVSEYIGLSTRFMLYNLGQIIENPVSGYVQRAITTVGYAVTGRVDNQELKAQRRKVSKARSKSIIRDGGSSYGDTTSLLVHESQLESWANKHYDNEKAHRIISLYMGRGHLEAYDSRHKTMLTEFYFVQNLAKMLTDKTNPNRMSKIEAQNFITEKLTGQSFDNALFKAAEITKNINDDAGKKILNDNPRSLAIFAQEIMKDALLDGEMMTIEQTEAAYKAAYMTAGRDIGHVANNTMSRAVGQANAYVGKELEKALQEENWALASWLTLSQMFTRNILFTFVGGGTNWVVLQMQKSNVIYGSISLYDDWSRQHGKELDLTSEEGTKALEETLYRSLNYKNTAIRTITGTMVGIMMAGAAAATGADDELLKWLKKNSWAKKFFDKLTPDLLLFWLAYKEGALDQYFKQLVNAKVNLFDNSFQVAEALTNAFDKDGANGGAAGKLVGSKLNAPAPFRAVRDVRNVYNGLTGQPQVKSNFKATSFANGFFQGGLIDYLGFRPEGEEVQDGKGLKRPERLKHPKRPKH